MDSNVGLIANVMLKKMEEVDITCDGLWAAKCFVINLFYKDRGMVPTSLNRLGWSPRDRYSSGFPVPLAFVYLLYPSRVSSFKFIAYDGDSFLI